MAIIATTLRLAALGMLTVCGVCASPAHGQEAPPAKVSENAAIYAGRSPAMGVKIIDETWHDTARDRNVPVRIYLPVANPGADPAPKPRSPAAAPAAKLPVIILSHGPGGSRTTYGYFGNHLASQGYIVIAPTHAGSDTAAAQEWYLKYGTMGPDPNAPARPTDPPEKPGGLHGAPRTPIKRRVLDDPSQRRSRFDAATEAGSDQPGGWLMTSINNPDNLRNRPKDISFVIDQIPRNATLGPLADMDRIGVAGHSFGAHTAMCMAGMTVVIPADPAQPALSFRDKRVKAVLPMSPEGAGAMGIVQGAWDHFETPVLFLTGTRDFGPGGRAAAWRREAFDAIHGVDDYLITLEGAGHMTFALPDQRAVPDRRIGRTPGGVSPKSDGAPPAHPRDLIESLSTAFFDAYLRNDVSAKHWLQVFTMPKRSDCTAQFKPQAAPTPAHADP